MLQQFLFFLLFFLCFNFQVLLAETDFDKPKKNVVKPWFTGPLFTPAASIVPGGHVYILPHLLWDKTTGKYNNNWTVSSSKAITRLNPILELRMGLSHSLEFICFPQAVYLSTKGKDGGGFGDLPIGLGYQLYRDKNDLYAPVVKIIISETFPTGRYQNLDPENLGVDNVGEGAFATSLTFAVAKLMRFNTHNFLHLRWDVSVTIPSTVLVKGLNHYGGDATTRGRVFPGNILKLFCAAEYSLTQNWALALDIIATLEAKTRFKGATKTAIGGKSKARLSAAPAIEYNWSSSFGVIIGAWFSFAGRNIDRFSGAAGMIAYYY